MKKTLMTLILATMMSTTGFAQPFPSDEARLYLTQCSLRNFGAALSMWYEDHNQSYPSSLQKLVPNYLRAIPPGPLGSKSDWIYIPATDGKSFQMALPGQELAPSNSSIGAPRFTEKTALQPGPIKRPQHLQYKVELPKLEASNWDRDGHHFSQKDKAAYMSFYLAGPFAEGQSGAKWVKQAASEWGNAYGVNIESKTDITDRELSGLKVEGADLNYRFTKLFVTDGELGWVFSLVAKPDTYAQRLNLFEKMVANRRAPKK